jgi:hypothetical protein
MAARPLPWVAGVLAALACGCGEEPAAPPPASTPAPQPTVNRTVNRNVDLTVRVADGEGRSRRASLTCGAVASGTGFYARAAARHCRSARRLARFLSARAPAGRACTEIYGGPQTARVRGTAAGRRVARDLHRRDGCAIADWDRAAPLLAPSGLEPGAPGP